MVGRREKPTYYFYIDFEAFNKLDDDYGRFHAQWRRENPTVLNEIKTDYNNNPINLTGEDNYTILDAKGKGHYVGCHLDIDMPTS